MNDINKTSNNEQKKPEELPIGQLTTKQFVIGLVIVSIIAISLFNIHQL